MLSIAAFWNRDPVPSGKNILTFHRTQLATYIDESSMLL